MGETPVYLSTDPTAGEATEGDSGYLSTDPRAGKSPTPTPGFYDALKASFPSLGGFIEGATPVVKEGIRHAGDIALGAGKMLVTPPSQQAADMATDLSAKYAAGTLDPIQEAVRGTTGVDIKGQPIDIAEDLLALGLGGRFLGGEGATGERPVPVRPEAPRAPRGGEATPARPILRPRALLPEAAGPTGGDVVEGELLNQLPPHEPPGLPPAREPIAPPPPAGPRGLLPEQGGGPFESPGEELPPRIGEASRNQQRPQQSLEDYLASLGGLKQPADVAPMASMAPTGPSDLDLAAQALGFKDFASMQRSGDAMAPARQPRLDPTAFRERATADPVAQRLDSLGPVTSKFGDMRSPFPVDEAGAERAWETADRDNPTLERVPVDRLVATQDAVERAGVNRKLQEGASDLETVPPRSVGRMNDQTVNVIEGPDGRMHLAGGTHRAAAAWARGDKDIQAVVYRQKGRSGAAPETAAEPRAAEPTPRPPTPVDAVQDFLRGPEATPEPAAPDHEADAAFPEVLADARKNGYTGTDEELRQKFDESVRSARTLQGDMRSIARNENPFGSRPLQETARVGGLKFDPEHPYSGELADLWESMDTGTTPKFNRKGSAVSQRGSSAGLEGIGAIMRKNAGLDLGALSEYLGQDPQFRALADQGEGAMHNALVEAIRSHRQGLERVPTFGEALRFAGVEPGAPWWKEDVLDTGEVQPRLPGETGAVRETETPTPEEDFPFSLEREAVARGEVQPSLRETAPDIRPSPAVPKNLRDFLTRQLGIPPNEVDAMTPEQATALGEQVRTHPEGVQAGIRANRRLPPANPEPVPPLEAAGRGELAAVARRRQMMKTAVPRGEVNVPRGTSAETGLVPRRTIEQRLAAGERLTDAERAQAGLEPSAPPERPQYSPSELGVIQSGIREAARDRARLLEAGTPESLAEYEKLLAEASDRQVQRELVHNRGEAPKRTGRGEILAGGPLGFLAYAPEAWNTLKEMAPDIARVIKPMLPESLGGEPGKPLGTQELHRAPNPAKDMNPALHFAHPNYALPDLWKQIRPELELAHDAAGEQAPPGVDKATWAKVTHDLWNGDAIKTIDQYAREARANGRPNAALYARMMASQLRGLPTAAEKIAEAVTFGKVSPQRARQIFRAAENVLYNRLFIGAVDTGLLTRSQVLAAMPHLGLGGVLEGLREGRTPEGAQLAKGVTNLSPTDTALSRKISNSTVRKLVTLVTNPVGVAHQANRRDTFLSGVHVAMQAGETPERAKDFAYDLQELVHGSPLSTNPYLRHLGPLRMLSKYPIVMAQLQHAILTHPDPGVRRRGLGFLLGAGAVGAVLGVSTMDYFLPHLKTIGGPALKIAQDAVHHVMGSSDHSILEDIDPRRGGTALTGRYPAKVLRTAEDVSKRGLGTHTKLSPQGQPEGETSGIDELANLLGLHTRYGLPDAMGLRSSNEADRNAAMDEATQFIQNAERERNIGGRLAREDAARGDADALQRLTPSQRRSFQKAQQQTAFQALLARVPVKDRPEFIRRFAERFTGGS